jgi:hypothetical protein
MRILRVTAALVVSIFTASCSAPSPSAMDDGFDAVTLDPTATSTAESRESLEGLRAPGLSPTATTPCEDACFVLYLAACAVCAKQKLGRACYEAAMEEYVRCARACRENN